MAPFKKLPLKCGACPYRHESTNIQGLHLCKHPDRKSKCGSGRIPLTPLRPPTPEWCPLPPESEDPKTQKYEPTYTLGIDPAGETKSNTQAYSPSGLTTAQKLDHWRKLWEAAGLLNDFIDIKEPEEDDEPDVVELLKFEIYPVMASPLPKVVYIPIDETTQAACKNNFKWTLEQEYGRLNGRISIHSAISIMRSEPYQVYNFSEAIEHCESFGWIEKEPPAKSQFMSGAITFNDLTFPLAPGWTFNVDKEPIPPPPLVGVPESWGYSLGIEHQYQPECLHNWDKHRRCSKCGKSMKDVFKYRGK